MLTGALLALFSALAASWTALVVLLLSAGFIYYEKSGKKRTPKHVAPGGHLRMTWLEEHMLKNDTFPPSLHSSPTCMVINSAMYFKDGMPEKNKVEKLLQDKLLYFFRFSSVPDFENHTWRAVKVNIEDHVIMHSACADNKALEDEINDVISHALDLTKPAWEVHMIPVENGDDCIIFRSHHSIGDGLSLMTAYESMATTADGSPAKIIPPKKPSAAPKNSFIMAILMGIEYVRSFLALLWACYMPLESSFSFNTPIEHRAGDMRWSGSRRAVLFKPFSLEYVRAITKKTPKKTTINDVLLSATVGAIKAYSGNTVDSKTIMRMLLPFGFEAKLDDMPANDRLTNGFAFCSCDLSKPIRSSDPETRLMATNKTMNGVKHSLEARVSFWMMNQLFARAPIGFYQKTARKVFANHTAIFSNVPGPTTSQYFAGKEVTGAQAIFMNAIPQVTLVSYDGKVYYNITLDPTVVKDWEKLDDLFRNELLAMGKAVGVEGVSL
ncbi:hypothetical protein FOL47_007385 [Perkinsus chesapeaki]|uniref:Diacylglycerol O-acyltransferase n=1 Tax=Perkinsus chesapeaki TaxID=330153 RepID=A0A7J6LLW1_PERCH|nr:hypothetical protein FOL47_007385 [Perkinsus chesapeaki]